MTPTHALILLASTLGLLACGAEKTSTDPLQQQVNKLVFVKGGSFPMGDGGTRNKKGELVYRIFPNALPVHQVTLTSYSIQAYETTFAEFDVYSRAIGEEILGVDDRHWQTAQPNNPAKWMTWQQARSYCQWLGEQIGYPMDLPTEAQWEYAARSRGKTNIAYATDNGHRERGRNIRDPAKDDGHNTTPVGSWPPNPLGIYDMTGNVDEWTLDSWHAYREKPLIDPSYETARSKQKVSRGGGIIGKQTLYVRNTLPPDTTGAGVGVRCVVNHPEKITSPRQSAQ